MRRFLFPFLFLALNPSDGVRTFDNLLRPIIALHLERQILE